MPQSHSVTQPGEQWHDLNSLHLRPPRLKLSSYLSLLSSWNHKNANSLLSISFPAIQLPSLVAANIVTVLCFLLGYSMQKQMHIFPSLFTKGGRMCPFFTFILFWGDLVFAFFAQAGVPWCDLSSLKPPPPRSSSSALASQVVGITGAHHHAQLILYFLIETWFHHIGQASLELLTSGNLPSLVSQSARITGVSHCALPIFKIFYFF